MNQQGTSCSDDRLRSLLQSDNDVGDEDRLSAKHIAECQRCQSRLEELAAEPDAWSEARDSLLSGDDHDAGRRAARSGRPWVRHRWQHRTTAWTESMSRQLLSPPSHPEMLGRIGRYEVERLIGAGGMGVVFKAFDTELNRPVAVKVLAPILAGSGAARQRFAREARAAAAVVHEHVVSIHNVETDGKSPFLVMQYVAGESLQGRIDHEGVLDVCEVLRIGMQTAAGLAAAHAQGLVHRDVKPSNILLEKGIERTLLTDFGLARASDDASLTHTGYHPGTPQYMSPEQARGDAVDLRSDLFSLGSVLYTMCTGRPPFRAETSYGILRRITDTEPRSIREINPNIPDWLESIVAKLMAKQADERFASADEVAELLEDCLAHVQQPTTVPLPERCGLLVESHKEDQRTAAGPRFPRKPPARALRLVMGAAAALALIFAGILIVLELNKGTLTIDCEADNVPVRIKQGNNVAKRLTVTRGDNTVRIAAGEYVIEIDGAMDGLTVANERVTLRRGGREVVTIIKEEELANRARKANLVADEPRPKEAQITVPETPETEESIPEPPRDPLFENLSPQQQVSLTDPPLWVRNVSGRLGDLDWPQRTGPIVLDNDRLLIGQSVLDLRTGKEIERLPLATDEFAPTYLRLSADRKFLMVCGQTVPPVGVFLKPAAVIQVWDIAQRKQVGATIGTQLLPITWNGSVADISADGKVVAAGGRSGKIALWSVVDAQLLKEAPFKSGRLDAIALSPDGQWLVISDTNDLTYWKWQTNEKPRTIHVGRKIDSLAFSPNGRYLAEGPDARGDIQIRDMTTLKVIRAVKDKAGSPFIVCAAALKFSADGSKLIAGNEAMVDWRKLKVPYRLFIWDVESGKLLRQIATPNHLVRGVDISPDGKHIAARLDSSYVAVWSTEKEEVSRTFDSPAKTMPVEVVLPKQFAIHWPGAMERSPKTARFAVPVSEPSHIRLDEIIGHHGLEIGVTIEPTDYATSEEFLKRKTRMRIKISAEDLAALKSSKLWTFTYEEEEGKVIALIKITARLRPITPISDIKELEGTWRLVNAHLVSDQPLGLPFHDLEGYKSARIAIDGPEWRHVRQGNELFRTLEATYDLTASPQKVDLKFTFRESEKHERRLIELHGDELITARQVVSPADGFPASFDEPMVLIERYQRVGVVINRNEVDETVITISLGTSDGIRLNQQLQVTDGWSVLGTVEAFEIGKHESYARVVEWSADRPICKGDRLIPIGATDASQALDAGFPSDAVLQEMHDLLSEETRLKLDLRYVQQFLEGGKLFAKTDASKISENASRKESIESRQQEITNRLKVIHESKLGDLRKVAENAGLECAEEPLYGQSSYGVIVYANTLDRIQKDELLLFHAGSLYRTRGTIRPLRTTGSGFFLRPNVAIPSGRHIALSCIQDAEEERENVKNGFMPDSNRARNPSRAYRANVYDRQSGELIQAEQAAANGPRAVLAEIEEAWTQRSMDVSTSRLSWTENRIYPRGEKLSPNEPEPLADDLTIAWDKKLIIAGDKCRIEGIGKTWDFRVRQMAPFEFTAVRNHTGSSYHNYPDQTDNLGYFSESLKGLADVTYRPALLGTNPGDPEFGRIDLGEYHVVPGVTEINGRKCIKLESNDNRTIDTELFLDPERQFVVARTISSNGATVTRQLDLSYKQDSRGIWYPASWQFQVLNGNLDRHAIHITVVTTEFDSDFVASPEDFEIQYQPGTLIYDQRTQGTTVKLRVQEDGSHQATSNTDSREDGRELQDPNVISPSLKTPTTDWESTSHDLESYRIDLVPFESRSRQLWDSSPTINEE